MKSVKLPRKVYNDILFLKDEGYSFVDAWNIIWEFNLTEDLTTFVVGNITPEADKHNQEIFVKVFYDLVEVEVID